jgi:transposase
MDASLFPEADGDHVAPAATPRPCGKPRLRTAQRDQVEMRWLSLDQLLPPEHEARLVWDHVLGLDLSHWLASIKSVVGHVGHPAIDPRILFALWLYATVSGVSSARYLDKLCIEHLAYEWLCGGVSVNYHTLADFRSDHGEALNEQLTASVAVLMEQELVTLQRVAQDGMRVRAAAGADTFRRRRTLEECLVEAEEQVRSLQAESTDDTGAVSARQQAARQRAARERQERLAAALQQLPQVEAVKAATRKGKVSEARVSTTDAEARVMKMGDGGYRPAYNVQFTTDVFSGMIVDMTVTQQGTDQGQLGESVQRTVERYGQAPAEVLVDGGFVKLDDIETVATEHGTEVYAPPKDEEKQLEAGKDPYAAKRGDGPAVAAWRQRMGTAAAKEIYRQRCSTAEWVNAGARNRGLYQFRVRGLVKVMANVLWQVLAHNLQRLWSLQRAAAATT